jgi:hypothetical protein
MTTTLDYNRLPASAPMIWLHRIALACALVPMAVGVLAFLLFVATRSLDFAILGFFTLVAGCALAFVGSVCLGVYRFQASRAAPDEAAIARRRAKRDLFLLLANFPLGVALALGGLAIMDSAAHAGVNVVIRNDDPLTADLITLDTGAGDTQQLIRIHPGGTTEAPVKFGPQGLSVTLTRSGTSTRHQIFDHMDSDTVNPRQDLRLVIRNGQVVLEK